MIRENHAAAIKGAGALQEALELIGAQDKTDHDMAKVIVDNELELRELVRFALDGLAGAV